MACATRTQSWDYLQFEFNIASVRIRSQGEIHVDLELGSACSLTRVPG
jgi:hypothetical protein